MVGVQALVESGIKEVPSDFKHKFDICASAAHVELPVIDLSKVNESFEARTLAVEAIREASREWSGFQIVGHGVTLELMERTAELAQYFFSMPEDDRNVYYSEDAKKPFRFGSSNPKMKLWYDYLFHTCPVEKESLPSNVPFYWETASEYSTAVDAAAGQLLELFSEALGLKAGALKDSMGDVCRKHTMRINYYPPCPNPELAIGSEAHTDPGSFTILQQDPQVEGLQIFHNGTWMLAKPMLGAFVVNIADQLEIVSNGRFKSLKHRVILNSTKPRVSVASFYYPQDGGTRYIAPLLLDDGEAPKYTSNTFFGYLEVFKSCIFSNRTAIDVAKVVT